MKIKRVPVFVFISLLLCLFTACKKKQAEPTELEKLPPATQTGANTFGCLVNGQAFLPSADLGNGGPYQCNYIYSNGGYYLGISASSKSSSNYITLVSLAATNLTISEGQVLNLITYQSGNGSGEYSIITNSTQTNDYKTKTNIQTGQLHISKFDQANQIISGTFFFDAINSNSEIVHITDGRFDMKYTM
jgi:hypothetical protein